MIVTRRALMGALAAVVAAPKALAAALRRKGPPDEPRTCAQEMPESTRRAFDEMLERIEWDEPRACETCRHFNSEYHKGLPWRGTCFLEGYHNFGHRFASNHSCARWAPRTPLDMEYIHALEAQVARKWGLTEEGLAMPAKSKKQQKFMGLCAHNPEKARGKCPPKAVAKKFAKNPKASSRKGGRRR